MIVIQFNDFKKFALENNKRIYYFQVQNIIELYYIIDGVFVKSFVNLDEIIDKETFFGDKLFIGATKLLLNVKDDNGDDVSVNVNASPILSIIELSKTEEGENKDLQVEGVN
jgi:hypothetical protein